jgi:serine/threonine protein kinase
MALAAGTRFGAFEITRQLGAGGMGEVCCATDTKLGREVAIKTLPSALAQDPERLARFEREAKLLAALNHAHIAAIYGLDEHGGTGGTRLEPAAAEPPPAHSADARALPRKESPQPRPVPTR